MAASFCAEETIILLSQPFKLLTFGELLLWSLTTTAAMLLAWLFFASLFFVSSLMSFLTSLPTLQPLLSLVAGLIGGAIVGSGQKAILKNKVNWASVWFWATIASWGSVALAWWVEYQVLGGSHFEVGSQDLGTAILITSLISGMVIGVVQWLILRRYTDISFLWIASTTASWLLAGIASAIVITQLDFGIYTSLVALLVPGVIIGLGTGSALDHIPDTEQ